ncbi:MAG: BREX-1 system phosphatase PglZ type B [Clostridiaceae bacterium]|nr:BREX-1 system phosphatase PglZ type B [Clostridiaceae bacterium]
MTVIENLVTAIRDSAKYNPDVQAAPSCILWPDKEKQWQSIASRIQSVMPELLVLGPYQHDKKTGPAIWIRCAIAGTLDDISIPSETIPVIYLPGVSRLDLRGVESCPDNLKPLAFLQYRGCIWSQSNTKDWTLSTWLKSGEGGLALDVDQDNGTKNALQIAINALLDERIEVLRNRHLDAAYFNTLLTGGDPVRDLLAWMEQGDAFKNGRADSEWMAFNEVCKSNFLFSPGKEGVLSAAEQLANHEGPWKSVWDRFCEAPMRYPHIPDLIRKCMKPDFDLFADETTTGGWPQWNDEQEGRLRKGLNELVALPEHEARKRILKLNAEHAPRRSLVWTELGMSPYVVVLEYLSIIAEMTANSLAGGTENDIVDGYRSFGWKIDNALLSALSSCGTADVFEAASIAIRALYYPWAEACAIRLQQIWDLNVPGKKMHLVDANDSCILFVDGLRYDCAKRLSAFLERNGYTIQEEAKWAPLPSVTGTGKPAVAPLAAKAESVTDDHDGYTFEVLNTINLRKIIKDNGYTILLNDGSPIPSAEAEKKLWVECGDIDHEGHSRGWKLARQIDVILKELVDLINSLSDKGWQKIKIVTDHGWLLVPGGLNKIDLPIALANTKWGRCASLKEGADSNERLFPWYWNPNQHFALANGISCFKAGEEYTHGGLSVQEALVLQLTVKRAASQNNGSSVSIADIYWKGLRCIVQVDGNVDGIQVDIRTEAGSPDSSVVVTPRALKSEGTASIVVEDDGFEGKKAFVVCIATDGNLVAQQETVVGGGT